MQQKSKKKHEFLNIRVTFGRSPNVTKGIFLVTFDSKFIPESIAHSACPSKRQESGKNSIFLHMVKFTLENVYILPPYSTC